MCMITIVLPHFSFLQVRFSPQEVWAAYSAAPPPVVLPQPKVKREKAEGLKEPKLRPSQVGSALSPLMPWNLRRISTPSTPCGLKS